MAEFTVDLDWLFDAINYDPGITIRYVPTKAQIADIFTKGSFMRLQWNQLCELAQLGVNIYIYMRTSRTSVRQNLKNLLPPNPKRIRLNHPWRETG